VTGEVEVAGGPMTSAAAMADVQTTSAAAKKKRKEREGLKVGEYHVERILGRRTRGRTVEYHIKWLNYGS